MIKNILKALGIKKKRVPKNRINKVWIHKINRNKKDCAYEIEFRYDNKVIRTEKLSHVDFNDGDSMLIIFTK
jgi:hypothetical protein